MIPGAIRTGPSLLLCFPSLSFAWKAVRSGLDLRLVVDAEHRSLFAALGADRTSLVDPKDEMGVAAVVLDLMGKHGITHVLDGDGFPATEVCPDFARAPQVLADDGLLAEVMARSRHPVVRSRVAAEAADVPGAVALTGRPAVVRSAVGESVVRSEAGAARWLRDNGGRVGPFTVAESVAGPEAVITTLTHDGMHRVVGITAKRAVAHGMRYLTPAAVGEAEAGEVRATVTAMLDLVGYEFGPAETTVVLAAGGPRILRARPGFGTRGIARLIEISTGFDVQTELLRAVAGVPVRPPQPRWFAGAEFFHPPRPGAGAALGEPRPHDLYVLAEGATPEDVEQRLDAARDRVRT